MSSYVEFLSHIRSAYNSLKEGGRFCGIVSAYSDQFPLKGENKVMKGQSEFYLLSITVTHLS